MVLYNDLSTPRTIFPVPSIPAIAEIWFEISAPPATLIQLSYDEYTDCTLSVGGWYGKGDDWPMASLRNWSSLMYCIMFKHLYSGSCRVDRPVDQSAIYWPVCNRVLLYLTNGLFFYRTTWISCSSCQQSGPRYVRWLFKIFGNWWTNHGLRSVIFFTIYRSTLKELVTIQTMTLFHDFFSQFLFLLQRGTVKGTFEAPNICTAVL